MEGKTYELFSIIVYIQKKTPGQTDGDGVSIYQLTKVQNINNLQNKIFKKTGKKMMDLDRTLSNICRGATS